MDDATIIDFAGRDGVTDLSRDEWVYIWADGIHSGLRGSDDRLCVLVVIGVNALGEKHFLAIEDGVRESTQSWREVLLSLKARGLGAPKLATGDGAMGFRTLPIMAFIDAHNDAPKPYKWVKSADEILASVKRFCLKTMNRTSIPGD